jgi:hypothetical protein
MTSKNCAALRQAILDFVIGASVRRLEQKAAVKKRQRYSMVVHTAQARVSHAWQLQVTEAIVEGFMNLHRDQPDEWHALVEEALKRFIDPLLANESAVPDIESLREEVDDLLDGVRVQRVNSDEDVFAMLDDRGQLRLESVLTIFIGGQILDRGVTIDGMIAFYYGRNPKGFQQDTVLQHSRMYGARPRADLPVTRFYTSVRLHGVMRKIHEFDHALRVALERGDDQGVAFIMEEKGVIRPCAPNKVLLSKLTSLSPHRRILPTGFNTKAPSTVHRELGRLDSRIDATIGKDGDPVLIELSEAKELVRMVCNLLALDHEDCVFDERAFTGALAHLSNSCKDPMLRGQVLVFTRRGRNAQRQFDSGRFNNVPFSGQDGELANKFAVNLPCLMLLRQEGSENQDWRGVPFWWPVLQAPSNMHPVVFSADVTSDA